MFPDEKKMKESIGSARIEKERKAEIGEAHGWLPSFFQRKLSFHSSP
jgi:hypothetical protein